MEAGLSSGLHYSFSRVSGSKSLAAVTDVPRVVIGTEDLVMYDWLPNKPRHGRVSWRDGIWASIQAHLPECRDRHCLLLLLIDPVTKQHTYQHGDPGPSIKVDPERAGFAQLRDWLQKVHTEEDVRCAMQAGRQPSPVPHAAAPTRKGLLAKVLGRRD
jgi:hypothetical protein